MPRTITEDDPMRDPFGYRQLLWVRRAFPYRVRQWLPRRGETCIRVVKGDIWIIVHWKPWNGLWVRSAGRYSVSPVAPLFLFPRPETLTMKRRLAVTAASVITPALPSTSTLWPKLPAIREFLHATAYEDGTPRQPGYLTVRNKVTGIEVTLYDPDSGTRLPCRGRTLDEALTLTEQLLGVEEAPWESDRYLMEQIMKLSKKKK
jgi:hypothetical protein